VKGQLAVVTALTAISQLAAFFKLWFTAKVFGVGSELDGYNLALVLPTLISGVMLGFLQTGFFPVRARLHAEGDERRTESFERATIWAATAAGCAVSITLAAGTPWLSGLIGGSSPDSVTGALRFVFPLVAMVVALNMLGDCAGYLLAIRGRFSIAAGAPIVNGLLGGLVLAWWPEGRLTSLVAGTLVGLTAQIAICLFGLNRIGFSLFGSVLDRFSARVLFADVARIGAWILPGVFFSNLIVSLPSVWIASFGEGAVSAFGYAYRLHSSAVQLLVMASSTIILANFSTLVAQNDQVAIRRILRKARFAAIGIGATGAFVVWVAAVPVLEWLFVGRFDIDAAVRVGTHWLWLTGGLGFALLGNVYAKLWQAQGRSRLISVMAGCGLASLCIGYMVCRDALSEYALSAALSISAITVVVIGARYLANPKREITG
jgi:peptidoglycan biosynthesis protein MviN/MurJ (putative lipid II flippase)